MASMTVGSMHLAHVALTVTDASRASRFYTDVLGLEDMPRPDFGIPGAWLSMGTSMIHLVELPEMPPQDPVGHFALTVATDQIAPLIEAVREGGGTVVTEPFTREDFGIPVTAAFVTDTEGNKFEITDAG